MPVPQIIPPGELAVIAHAEGIHLHARHPFVVLMGVHVKRDAVDAHAKDAVRLRFQSPRMMAPVAVA